MKYPKFLLLTLTFVLAYVLFAGKDMPVLNNTLSSLGYLGTFLAGVFYAYGFTAAPATAILLILAKDQNILLAGLIAGFGALLADLIIFKLIRYSFEDEIKKISKEKIVKYLRKKMPNPLRKYLLPAIAYFIIASPLPDEIGVTMLAAADHTPIKTFYILSYVLNTAGVLIILILGHVMI